MAQNTATQQDSKLVWQGGNEPLGASYGKLMMWFFLISDTFTFTGLLVSYLYYRFIEVGSDTWLRKTDMVKGIPTDVGIGYPEDVFHHFPFMHGVHLPLLYVGLMTFILILSSVTMVLAVDAGHRYDRKNVLKWLGLTVLGGLAFVGSQAWEWGTFIAGSEHGALKELINVDGQVVNEIFQGANLNHNEYGHQLFADFFFGITGFHGMHVFGGVVINFIVLLNVYNNEYQYLGNKYEMVEKVGLYWHFVDLVWVFVFTLFYLL